MSIIYGVIFEYFHGLDSVTQHNKELLHSPDFPQSVQQTKYVAITEALYDVNSVANRHKKSPAAFPSGLFYALKQQ
jgi:hypothetical protein